MDIQRGALHAWAGQALPALHTLLRWDGRLACLIPCLLLRTFFGILSALVGVYIWH